MSQQSKILGDAYTVFDGTFHNVHFKLNLATPIAIVTGDSGTGKTLFYKASVEKFNLIYKMEAFSRTDIDTVLYAVRNHIQTTFVLDRADTYFTRELGEAIMDRAVDSKFVIFGRELDDMPLISHSLKEMVSVPEGTGSLVTLKDYI